VRKPEGKRLCKT